MKVSNETPFELRLSRDSATDELSSLYVVTRVICELGADGPSEAVQGRALGPPNVAPWPGFDPSPDSGRVDLIVEGTVCSARPFTRKEVVLRVDDEERRISAMGPRRWMDKNGEVVPGEPAATGSVPMSWALAYGGRHRVPPGLAEGTGLPGPTTEIAWPANPGGCGFYRTADQALDMAVPQLVHAGQSLARWDDRPQSVCWAALPSDSGVHMSQWLRDAESAPGGVVPDAASLSPRAAMPEMQFELRAGSSIGLLGFLDNEIVATVPQPPFIWQAWTAGLTRAFQPWLSRLILLPNAGLMVLFYRTALHVPLIRYEPRAASQVPARKQHIEEAIGAG